MVIGNADQSAVAVPAFELAAYDPRVPRRSPDDNLAAENYVEINRAYYTAEPADDFQERLDNLLITAGAPEGRADVIRRGGSFGEV